MCLYHHWAPVVTYQLVVAYDSHAETFQDPDHERTLVVEQAQGTSGWRSDPTVVSVAVYRLWVRVKALRHKSLRTHFLA